MDLGSNGNGLLLAAQAGGMVLFGLVFLYLWRQSRIVYFGLWALAWAAKVLGLIFGFWLFRTWQAGWLIPYAFLQFAVVILLFSAARAGLSTTWADWRSPLGVLAGFPILAGVIIAAGGLAPMRDYFVLEALALCFVYVYNWKRIHATDFGAAVFRWTLLALAAILLEYSLLVWRVQAFPGRSPYLEWNRFGDFAGHALLAFAALIMWIGSQNQRLRDLAGELEHVRRESAMNLDLDRLTGLLNQAALARRMEATSSFKGVVAVCDMDDFKEINDRYGHLVGDEILHNIGKLLKASIRHEDEAFRWGGDEFVILFHNQRREIVESRMRVLQARLQGFQVRGHGVLPISFSWGVSETEGRPLRETLDDADRAMYTFKRGRPARKG
jgi:diguanylate cyclase (GGDEF)-like protein